GASNSFVTFTVPAGGMTVPLTLDFFENQGGDDVELSVASGFRTSFTTTTFSLLGNTVQGWTVSDPQTTGTPNYRSLIGTDVQALQGLNVLPTSSDFLIYPELQGFKTQVGTTPAFYSKPTPGAPNTTAAFTGVVADTKFSVDRGFFSAPFQVEITTATEGAEIRYTTNGDTPTPTTGTVYTGPLTIDHTTTLRAGAFKAGFAPTNSDTQTYIFPADVILQSPNGEKPGPNWPAAGQVNGQ